MPNFWNMPNAKIDMPSLQKHAKFVFFGRKYANMTTLVFDPLLCVGVRGDQWEADSENPEVHQLLRQSFIRKTQI